MGEKHTYRLGDLLGMALRGEITPDEAQAKAQERVEYLSTARATGEDSPANSQPQERRP